MVRGAAKIEFTAVELLRVTPSLIIESTIKSVFNSRGYPPSPSKCTVTPESIVWSSPSSAIGTIDPITKTEFEFVLVVYILPLS